MLSAPEFNFMRRTLIKGARAIRRDFNEIENLQTTHTGIGVFATKSRKRVEDTLIDEVNTAQKDNGIIVDGTIIKKPRGNDTSWLIIPLDGFENYNHAIGHYAMLMAKKQQNKITHACIYQPFLDNFYTAQHDKGAYADNTRLRVSSHKSSLHHTCMCYNIPVTINEKRHMHEMTLYDCLYKLRQQKVTLRQNGCISLDILAVAQAKIQIYLDCVLPNTIHDIAVFFVREAGGQTATLSLKNPKGEDIHLFLATNRFLHAHTHKTLSC